MNDQQLIVSPTGTLHCLYSEAINLRALGELSIERASQVEPDEHGRWHADLSVVSGPTLGPFDHRSQALNAERDWLEANRLGQVAATD